MALYSAQVMTAWLDFKCPWRARLTLANQEPGFCQDDEHQPHQMNCGLKSEALKLSVHPYTSAQVSGPEHWFAGRWMLSLGTMVQA